MWLDNWRLKYGGERAKIALKKREAQAKQSMSTASDTEEIDEIKKKKRKMDTDIKSLNETADELCLKAESTGKLIFVTQANSLRKTAKEKFQELTDLNASLNSKLHVEKLKE